MVNQLKNLGAKILVSMFSVNSIETIIHYIIAAYLKHLNAVEGLRFLFRLDNYLYNLEGAKAIEYGNGLHTKHKHTKYHDFFTQRIKTGEKVLDVGCGNGLLAYSIATKSNAYVTGIDISKKNIKLAKTRHKHERIEFLNNDIMTNLNQCHHDVIVLSNVLEHLKDRPNFLKKIQAIIKPDRFLIRVPMYERDWRVPLKKELELEWRLDSTHETEYTIESFKVEMDTASLDIIHKEIRWGEIWAEVKCIGT